MTGHYEVQKIVGKRIRDQKDVQYKVKWKNYDSSQNTWEPLKNLKNVQKMLKEFEQRNKDKLPPFGPKTDNNTSRSNSIMSKKKNSKNGSQKSNYIQLDEVSKLTKKADPFIKKGLVRKKKNEPTVISESEDDDIEETNQTQQKPSKKTANTIISFQQKEIDLDLASIASKIMSVTKAKKKQFSIISIKKRAKGENDLYIVKDSEGNQQQKQRQYVLKNLPLELIAFYQKQVLLPKSTE